MSNTDDTGNRDQARDDNDDDFALGTDFMSLQDSPANNTRGRSGRIPAGRGLPRTPPRETRETTATTMTSRTPPRETRETTATTMTSPATPGFDPDVNRFRGGTREPSQNPAPGGHRNLGARHRQPLFQDLSRYNRRSPPQDDLETLGAAAMGNDPPPTYEELERQRMNNQLEQANRETEAYANVIQHRNPRNTGSDPGGLRRQDNVREGGLQGPPRRDNIRVAPAPPLQRQLTPPRDRGDEQQPHNRAAPAGGAARHDQGAQDERDRELPRDRRPPPNQGHEGQNDQEGGRRPPPEAHEDRDGDRRPPPGHRRRIYPDPDQGPPSDPSDQDDSGSSSSEASGGPPPEAFNAEEHRRRRRARRRRRERQQHRALMAGLAAMVQNANQPPRENQNSMPKAELANLEDDTPESYTEFRRSFLAIMESRVNWTNTDRKSFLCERIRKRAAVLTSGIDFHIQNDEVSWRAVLQRVEDTFLTRSNSVNAQYEFRNASQKPREKLRIWAARLRDLHTRAFAFRMPDVREREEDYELRSQFLTGLAEPRLKLGFLSEVEKYQTLEGLTTAVNNAYFLMQRAEGKSSSFNMISEPTTSINAVAGPSTAAMSASGQDSSRPMCVICSKLGHTHLSCHTWYKVVDDECQRAGVKTPTKFLEYKRTQKASANSNFSNRKGGGKSSSSKRRNGQPGRKPYNSSKPGTSKGQGRGINAMDEVEPKQEANSSGDPTRDQFLSRILDTTPKN